MACVKRQVFFAQATISNIEDTGDPLRERSERCYRTVFHFLLSQQHSRHPGCFGLLSLDIPAAQVRKPTMLLLLMLGVFGFDTNNVAAAQAHNTTIVSPGTGGFADYTCNTIMRIYSMD